LLGAHAGTCALLPAPRHWATRLARHRRSSRASPSIGNAVDAFVVATTLEFDAAGIASGDPTDLARLAAPYRQISLMRLGLTVAEPSANENHSTDPYFGFVS
jgi:hypothetical protein